MIYINPSLTKTQVIDILAQTARRGDSEQNYEYVNNKSLELGYGIVDHEEAIREAIALIPSTEYEPWEDPILIEITNIPQAIGYGHFLEITYEVTLNSSISAGTEFIVVEIYFGEGWNYNNYQLIGEFTYDQFEQVTSFTESVFIPTSLSGGSVNKTIKVKATAFDENVNFLSYGFDSDYSDIEMAYYVPSEFILSAETTFLGVYCINSGSLSCLQNGGFAFKAKIKNVGTLDIGLINYYITAKANWTSQLLPNTYLNYSGLHQSKVISGFTPSTYSLNSYFNPPIIPGEERVVYLDIFINHESWDPSPRFYIQSPANFPATFWLATHKIESANTETLYEVHSTGQVVLPVSIGITLQSWPTCYTCSLSTNPNQSLFGG
jgi:hypothetical protein